MNYIKTFEASFLSRLKNPFKKSFEDGERESEKILLSLKGTNFGKVKEVRIGLEGFHDKKFHIDLKKSTIDSIISQSDFYENPIHNIEDIKIYIKPHISNETHTLDSIMIEIGFLLNGKYSSFTRNNRRNEHYCSVKKLNWIKKVEGQEEVKTENWVCLIHKQFIVNKDEVSRKIDDFIDDISTIGGFKRLGVDETIDGSLKSLDEKRKTKEFQKRVDDIKDCLYDIIDMSQNYRIFPNQNGSISCFFDIEGITTDNFDSSTLTTLNHKVIDILNSILEVEGRIKQIVTDCDIKMSFNTNKLSLIIKRKV